jgi:single-stranded-DNA-specific exonuclease
VSWHLPSRFEEGYGLSGETLTRLAGEETGLVLTVDCGITAVEEVVHAKELGLDVVVTDHHRPGETLPDCPVVATRPSEYPFPELCGTGVVYKLAQALGAATSTAGSTSSGSPRWPMSFRSSTRTAGWSRQA